MNLVATLVCIGSILAILASGAWVTRKPNELDEETVLRLRDALTINKNPPIPLGSTVLQIGGVGLGKLAVTTAVGDVRIAKRLHPEMDFRNGDAMQLNMFLPESFTYVIICEIDFVKHKSILFQNAYSWLMPGGILILDSSIIQSKGNVEYTSTEIHGRLLETIKYHKQISRTTRNIYRESLKTIHDMASSAGFAFVNGVFVKAG